MNEFLAICLYAFAGCAALGMLAALALAARERKPGPAAAAVLIAVFAAWVLVASGVRLW